MEERRRKKSENFLQPWWMSNVRMCKKRRWTEISPRGNKKRYCQPPPNFFELLQSSTTMEINQISRDYIIYFLKLRICTYVCGEGHFWNFRGNENIVVCKNGNKKLSLHTFFVFIILGFIRPVVVVYIRLLTDLALVGCCLIR